MKIVLFALALTVSVLSAGLAQAQTCKQVAERCLPYQPRSICFDSQRMAQCKKTGYYIGPGTGKAWPAPDEKRLKKR
jgi:hypothetical protein